MKFAVEKCLLGCFSPFLDCDDASDEVDCFSVVSGTSAKRDWGRRLGNSDSKLEVLTNRFLATEQGNREVLEFALLSLGSGNTAERSTGYQVGSRTPEGYVLGYNPDVGPAYEIV